MNTKIISYAIALLFTLLCSFSAQGQKKYTYECIGCDVAEKADCKDCGGRISQSSFSGIRVKKGSKVVKELHFPFEIHRSGSKVCIEELADDRETYCLNRSQTYFGTTRMFFDSLLNCQKAIIGAAASGSLPSETITSIINTVGGNPIGTYISEDGTSYTLNETITTYNNPLTTGTLIGTYTNESGSPVNVYTPDYSISLNPLDSSIVLTNTEGLTSSVDLKSVIENCIKNNATSVIVDVETNIQGLDSVIITVDGTPYVFEDTDTQNTLTSTDGSVNILPIIQPNGSIEYDLDIDLFNTDTTGLKTVIRDCIVNQVGQQAIDILYNPSNNTLTWSNEFGVQETFNLTNSSVVTRPDGQGFIHDNGLGMTYNVMVDTLDQGAGEPNTLEFDFNGTMYSFPYCPTCPDIDSLSTVPVYITNGNGDTTGVTLTHYSNDGNTQQTTIDFPLSADDSFYQITNVSQVDNVDGSVTTYTITQVDQDGAITTHTFTDNNSTFISAATNGTDAAGNVYSTGDPLIKLPDGSFICVKKTTVTTNSLTTVDGLDSIELVVNGVIIDTFVDTDTDTYSTVTSVTQSNNSDGGVTTYVLTSTDQDGNTSSVSFPDSNSFFTFATFDGTDVAGNDFVSGDPMLQLPSGDRICVKKTTVTINELTSSNGLDSNQLVVNGTIVGTWTDTDTNTQNTLSTSDTDVTLTTTTNPDGTTNYDITVDHPTESITTITDDANSGDVGFDYNNEATNSQYEVSIDTTINGDLITQVISFGGQTMTSTYCATCPPSYTFDIDTMTLNDTMFFYHNVYEDGVLVNQDTTWNFDCGEITLQTSNSTFIDNEDHRILTNTSTFSNRCGSFDVVDVDTMFWNCSEDCGVVTSTISGDITIPVFDWSDATNITSSGGIKTGTFTATNGLEIDVRVETTGEAQDIGGRIRSLLTNPISNPLEDRYTRYTVTDVREPVNEDGCREVIAIWARMTDLDLGTPQTANEVIQIKNGLGQVGNHPTTFEGASQIIYDPVKDWTNMTANDQIVGVFFRSFLDYANAGGWDYNNTTANLDFYIREIFGDTGGEHIFELRYKTGTPVCYQCLEGTEVCRWIDEDGNVYADNLITPNVEPDQVDDNTITTISYNSDSTVKYIINEFYEDDIFMGSEIIDSISMQSLSYTETTVDITASLGTTEFDYTGGVTTHTITLDASISEGQEIVLTGFYDAGDVVNVTTSDGSQIYITNPAGDGTTVDIVTIINSGGDLQFVKRASGGFKMTF